VNDPTRNALERVRYMSISQHLSRYRCPKTALLSCLVVTLVTLQSPAFASEPKPPAPEQKSPAKAVRLSLLSTVIPVVAGGGALLVGLNSNRDNNMLTIVGGVTGVFGLTVGPSVGHSYAENGDGGGLVLRLGTTLLGSIVTAYALTTRYETFDAPQPGTDTGALVLGTTLLGISAISAVHDIVSAGDAARRYNQTHGFTTVRLAPAYFAQSKAPGLAIHIGF